ncbi:MAG: putative lipid II flippase FtsW [Deltaproteobacteria bacterium]|nr:putative lipid II flippase FtsW [Deltaproteobacteria bacterium]MBW2417043.1 putative lipid II flippase FtsW [Deltaproteobacteria bacterium]
MTPPARQTARTPERNTRRRRADAQALQHPAESGIHGLDGGLVVSAGVLITLGVVMSYSTTAPLALGDRIPPLFLNHLAALSLGLCAAFVAALLPIVAWHRLALPLWLIGVVLLIITALLGVEVNGARRWVDLPGLPFRFQPVELAKCATLLAVATVVAPRDGHSELSRGQIWLAGGLTLPPVALLLLQPDLGNAVLLALLVVLMLIVAGIRLRALVLPAVLAAIGIASYLARNPYAMRRVTSFWDPWKDAQGAGFQLVQSFVAFSQGGLSGEGLGNGRQKLFYLPEAHTDFVLSLVAEELGLIGVLVVLCAFTALLVAGTRIARRARARFTLLLAFAATTLLTVPAMVNAGVVMGLLPTKGLTLPFLSYGGSSLVMCCAVLGLLLGIARRSAPDASARPAPGRA